MMGYVGPMSKQDRKYLSSFPHDLRTNFIASTLIRFGFKRKTIEDMDRTVLNLSSSFYVPGSTYSRIVSIRINGRMWNGYTYSPIPEGYHARIKITLNDDVMYITRRDSPYVYIFSAPPWPKKGKDKQIHLLNILKLGICI